MRKYFTPGLIIIALTAISVGLHADWCGTPMQSSEARWQELFEHHVTVHPFKIRYFTTYLVLGIHQTAGTPIKETFFVVQYILMAGVALAFRWLLTLLRFSRGWANFGMFLFLVSFPVLFAHSEPVFTWDDGWAYLFLVLCAISIIRSRIWLASFFFLLGCFAREQMLFYAPAVWLGINIYCKGESRVQRLLAVLLPAAVYSAFYLSQFAPPEHSVAELFDTNFGVLSRATNSLFSLFIAFGAIWVAWIVSLRRYFTGRAGEANQSIQFLVWASLLAVAPTVVLGTVLAQARETRLFFPPFVFVIPLALDWLQDRLASQSRSALGSRERWTTAAITVVSILLAVLVLDRTKPDLDFRNCPDFCYLWSGVQLGLSVGVIALAITTKRRAPGRDSVTS